MHLTSAILLAMSLLSTSAAWACKKHEVQVGRGLPRGADQIRWVHSAIQRPEGELQYISSSEKGSPTEAYLRLASGEICQAKLQGQPAGEIQFSGSENCQLKVATQARR